jgi:hypothetical protein
MSGERAAVEAVLAEIEDDDDAAQLGLFAEPLTEEGRRKLPARRGPGRPPGARNKRTERTIAWLLARHRDPRQVLLEVAQANVADLAALLGCSLQEAMVEKRLCAVGVLPYVAQKQPLAVDVTGRQVVYLNIHEGDVSLGGDGIGLAVRVLDNVEYQALSEGDDDKV